MLFTAGHWLEHYLDYSAISFSVLFRVSRNGITSDASRPSIIDVYQV